MRVLVTGGAGFLGSNTIDALVARGDVVVALDDLSTGSRGNLAPDVPLRVACNAVAAIESGFGAEDAQHPRSALPALSHVR